MAVISWAVLNSGFALVYLALACFFPISAIVYETSHSQIRKKGLEKDLGLLLVDGQAQEAQIKSCEKFFAHWHYAMHYLLTMVVTLLGVSLFFHPPDPAVKPLLLDTNTLQAMRYGFLGAYLFSIALVCRRYTTWDIQPSLYMTCTLTIIAGLAFNYVAFEAISNLTMPSSDTNTPTTGIGAGLMAITAFSFGFFPSLATRWFNRIAHTALNERQHRADAFPLGLIDGISRFHESRLLDEGIDNIQNLACANIEDLLCHTRYSAQQVMEWVDQAILYTYLETSEIEIFRRGGVRTISDFRDFWTQKFDKMVPPPSQPSVNGEDTWRRTRALQLQSTPERLDTLYRTTERGPNMIYVNRYWKKLELQAAENKPRHDLRYTCVHLS
jgi:hypothetical protein